MYAKANTKVIEACFFRSNDKAELLHVVVTIAYKQ